MEIDEIIYKDFLKGDNEAFDILMDRYMEKLIYFINSFVKNIDVAEDLSQDVFVYILMNKKEYDFKYSLKTYLFTIGKSRALNYLKKNNRTQNLIYENVEINESEIEESIFKKEKYKGLREAIKQLPLEQSRAIYLSSIEELSYAEICEILNMSMPKVKSLLHRGKRNLKKILIKKGVVYYE